MTNRKTTRRALVLSLLSLLLCCSMLVGTTFAWFTDSVTSGKNQIVAGNLDIELEYSKTMADGSWNTVNGATELFTNTLWEPGHTDVVYLRLSNLGTLALKYSFSMNFTDTVIGKTADNKDIKLSEHLKYDIVDVTAAYGNRDAAREAVEDSAKTLCEYKVTGQMQPSQAAKVMALVIYMPEEVGNEANYRGEAIPQIDLGLDLFATQLEAESDSFGSDYDEDAGWVGDVDTDWYNDTDTEFVITTAEELAGFAQLVNSGNTFATKTVKLADDINLYGASWTPIGTDSNRFKGTFDGQGFTISNLKVALGDASYAGLFGYGYGATVKGVNIENADVSAYSYSGAVIGRMYTGNIDDCHVTGDVKIVSTYAYAGGIVGGDYVGITNCSVLATDGEITVKEKNGAGGICGWHTEGKYLLTNLHVKNLKITAWCNLGGITGFVHYGNEISGCSVENVVLTKTRVDGLPSIGMAAGGWSYNASNAITIKDNTFKNIELNGNVVEAASASPLYGSEYAGGLNTNVVAENNTQENITNNLFAVQAVKTADALSAALAAGGTVVLGSDITMDASISLSNANFVLDGNGKTITMADDVTNPYALFDITGGNVTIQNVTFDGIKGGAIVRTVGAEILVDNITAKNGNHTQQQGLLRLLGKSTVTNSTFENNTCNMVITLNFDTDSNDQPQTIKNCVFEGNTCNDTAVVYYVCGSECVIDANKFVSNKVTSAGNAATVYVGFKKNVTVTNNLFQNNAVTTTHATTKRATGGLMVGNAAVVTGNAFIGNTITAEGRQLGNDVCASVYYSDIDLSGNYWGGGAPVENDDYFVEYPTEGKVIINDYLTTYAN